MCGFFNSLLGVKGDEAKLRSASDEFSGHCLALTLLGSYLTDASNGDIRSTIIIERLRRSCQIVLGTWSRFS